MLPDAWVAGPRACRHFFYSPTNQPLRLLRPLARLQVLSRLPAGLRASLLEERDPHGNVQVGEERAGAVQGWLGSTGLWGGQRCWRSATRTATSRSAGSWAGLMSSWGVCGLAAGSWLGAAELGGRDLAAGAGCRQPHIARQHNSTTAEIFRRPTPSHPAACHALPPCEQVAHIETEKLLIKLVHDELARRKANGTFHGKFSALSHYFG